MFPYISPAIPATFVRVQILVAVASRRWRRVVALVVALIKPPSSSRRVDVVRPPEAGVMRLRLRGGVQRGAQRKLGRRLLRVRQRLW
jgi:hypothetical protein